MNQRIAFVTSAVLFAGLTQAAPTISGVSGSVADGQTAVISGSAFGSNSLKQDWLGGSSGFIDSLPNNARFDQQNRANWSLMTPSTNTYPHVSTERFWSGGKSLAFDTRGTTEYKQTLFYDTGSAGYKTLYTNTMIYLSHDNLLSGSYLQWKIMRWYKVADVMDHAQGLSGAYMSNPMASGMVGVFTGWNSDQGHFVNWFSGSSNLPYKGAWYRYENWVKMNSSSGVADGKFRVKVTDPNTGAVVADNNYSNIVWNGSTDSGNLRYWVIQNYFGNATDGGYAQKDNANAVAWWDDIYVSQTEARVEICGEATWSQCKSREIQAASQWSDNSITVKLNKGARSSVSDAYLYVTDANGQVNSQGYRLSGQSAPVTVPNPPQDVRVN